MTNVTATPTPPDESERARTKKKERQRSLMLLSSSSRRKRGFALNYFTLLSPHFGIRLMRPRASVKRHKKRKRIEARNRILPSTLPLSLSLVDVRKKKNLLARARSKIEHVFGELRGFRGDGSELERKREEGSGRISTFRAGGDWRWAFSSKDRSSPAVCYTVAPRAGCCCCYCDDGAE